MEHCNYLYFGSSVGGGVVAVRIFGSELLDFSAALKDKIAAVGVPSSTSEGEGSTQRVLPNYSPFKSGILP